MYVRSLTPILREVAPDTVYPTLEFKCVKRNAPTNLRQADVENKEETQDQLLHHELWISTAGRV